jgi:peptidoglycan/xylan/chitin deacetylase (PgdA/CDA1 family)
LPVRQCFFDAVARIALKIDVDTDRGTAEGVPRLIETLERANAGGTFLFSLGPDNTGRALRRIFRRGFLGKVRRTSVLRHYGLKTLLYGTLLPGPHIGRRRAAQMRLAAQHGFEVGIHSFDHVKWQDGVAHASREWTRCEMNRAQAQFMDVFGVPAHVHGAAGWQLNAAVPQLQQAMGFRYASDTRGTAPFLPVVEGVVCRVPQIPTTLPTLDELIGLYPSEDDVARCLLARTELHTDHVFTLHAELEGGRLLGLLQRLLGGWQNQGYRLCDLAEVYAQLSLAHLPRRTIESGQVRGRSGTLAVEGTAVARLER